MNEILYHLKGMNGQLDVYEDKVIIKKSKSFSFVMGGIGDKTIPIDTIQSIQFYEANFARFGYIQFGILGAIEAKGGSLNAAYDENSVTFEKKYNNYAREIKDYLENKIMVLHSAKNTEKESISTADEIMKYKQLLDSGVLTEQEFDAKKKELLNL